MDKNVLEELGVTVFLRDGKYHWMVKSCSFKTPEMALRDAMRAFSIPIEELTYRKPNEGLICGPEEIESEVRNIRPKKE